jgi:hypothetical protein
MLLKSTGGCGNVAAFRRVPVGAVVTSLGLISFKIFPIEVEYYATGSALVHIVSHF